MKHLLFFLSLLFSCMLEASFAHKLLHRTPLIGAQVRVHGMHRSRALVDLSQQAENEQWTKRINAKCQALAQKLANEIQIGELLNIAATADLDEKQRLFDTCFARVQKTTAIDIKQENTAQQKQIIENVEKKARISLERLLNDYSAHPVAADAESNQKRVATILEQATGDYPYYAASFRPETPVKVLEEWATPNYFPALHKDLN